MTKEDLQMIQSAQKAILESVDRELRKTRISYLEAACVMVANRLAQKNGYGFNLSTAHLAKNYLAEQPIVGWCLGGAWSSPWFPVSTVAGKDVVLIELAGAGGGIYVKNMIRIDLKNPANFATMESEPVSPLGGAAAFDAIAADQPVRLAESPLSWAKRGGAAAGWCCLIDLNSWESQAILTTSKILRCETEAFGRRVKRWAQRARAPLPQIEILTAE